MDDWGGCLVAEGAWEKIYFNGENSDGCIFTVMTGLSMFTTGTRGHDIMAEFCKKALGGGEKSYTAKMSGNRYPFLYSHYVFSGPVGEGAYVYGGYAQDFARFLRENKDLGELYGSDTPVENKKWHPGRFGNTYVWVPNQQGVEAWWEKHQPADFRAEQEKKRAEAEARAQLAREQVEMARAARARAKAAKELKAKVEVVLPGVAS